MYILELNRQMPTIFDDKIIYSQKYDLKYKEMTTIESLLFLEPLFHPIPKLLSPSRDAWKRATALEISHKDISVIPESISLLTNISALSLTHNQLTCLPAPIGKMCFVTAMDLSENKLRSVPDSLQLFKNLQSVRLDHNGITSISETLISLSSLTQLSLSFNMISYIPSTVESLISLRILHLGQNKISSLPTTLGTLKFLQELVLSENKLTSIPPLIGSWENLTLLSIRDNQVSYLHPSISSASNLKKLSISGNKISGLPESFSCLVHLQELFLQKCHFEHLPVCVGHFKNLHKLFICNNKITTIPLFVTQLKKLLELNVEWYGQVSVSSLPVGFTELPCWSNISKPWSWMNQSYQATFAKLRLYKFHQEGISNILPLLNSFEKCNTINISENMISSLPEEFSRLSMLTRLNLSDNMFTAFPQVLPEMIWIASLDISGNKITQLPEGITAMTSLKRLKIAHVSKDVTITSAPIGITKLPCWETSKSLKQLSLYVLNTTPEKGALILESAMSEIRTDIDLMKEKFKTNRPPLLLLPNSKIAFSESKEACRAGVLCFLCMGTLIDPCALDCGHAFCTNCVAQALGAADDFIPSGCLHCHQPIWNQKEVSADMKQRANWLQGPLKKFASRYDSTNEYKSCQNASCLNPVSHQCHKCGFYCEIHFEIHNKSHPDHFSLTSVCRQQNEASAALSICLKHMLPIEYYCDCCPESFLKCAKCVLSDHGNQKEPHKMHFDIPKDPVDFKKTLLLKTRSKVDEELAKVRKNKLNLIDERAEFSRNSRETHDELELFINQLEKVLARLKNTAKKQLDSLEKEIGDQMRAKYMELEASETRLKFMFEAIDECIQKIDRLTIQELSHVVADCGRVVMIPTENVDLKKRRISHSLPKNFLDQMDDMSKRSLFRANVQSPTENYSESHVDMRLYWDVAEAPGGTKYFTSEIDNAINIYEKGSKSHRVIEHSLSIRGLMQSVRGISISPTGLVAVADAFQHSVSIYDPETMEPGLILKCYGQNQDNSFISPTGVSYDSKGRLFVSDSRRKSVYAFDEYFEPLAKVLVKDIPSNQLLSPISSLVHENGSLLVLCDGSSSIFVYEKDFTFQKKIQIHPRKVGARACIKDGPSGLFSVWEIDEEKFYFYDFMGSLVSETKMM